MTSSRAPSPDAEREPLVSVVIATRDRGELLHHALTSAMQQTYPALEIIVVDDGSVDPVTPPSRARPDRPLTFLRLETPQGVGAARNLALQHCNGSLVAFLDDDDVWVPGKTAEQVAALQGCSADVGAVESGFEVYEGDRLIERYLPRRREDLQAVLLEHPCMTPSTVLVRKSALDAIGDSDPTLLRMEDWDLWLRFSSRYRTVTLPEVHAIRGSNPLPAATLLPWYVEMVRRMEPLLAERPTSERRRLRAVHAFQIGVLQAQAGHSAAARRSLWHAWRLDPTSLRFTLHLLRTLMGETLWRGLSTTVHGLRRRVLRRLGRDPYLYRW